MPKLNSLHKILDPEIRAKNLRELRYQLRGLWWDMARPAMPDPVFLVGCSRSGTTVTYETLAAAPQFLKFGWEIPQFWDSLYGPLNNGWQSEAAGAEHARPAHRDAAMRYFFQRLGHGWVLDKTCINVLRIPYLHALFPDAKFVFIQRDGRDNISSMMDGWRHGRTDGDFHLSQFFGPFPEPVAINGGEFTDWAFFLAPGWQRVQPRQPGRGVRLPVAVRQPAGARRQARHPAGAVDPAALRGHFRAAGGDVPRRLSSAWASRSAKRCATRCANLRPTSIVKGTPQEAEVEGAQPRGHRAHPAPDPAAHAGAGLRSG